MHSSLCFTMVNRTTVGSDAPYIVHMAPYNTDHRIMEFIT